MALTTSTEMGLVATPGILRSDAYANRRDYVLRFHITVPTSPGTAPAPVIQRAPKGFKPDLVYIATDGLSASGGVALTVKMGDAGDDDRLVAAQDFDAAASYVGLALAAADYEYTAETDIILTMAAGKTPVAAQKIWGCILGSVPSA